MPARGEFQAHGLTLAAAFLGITFGCMSLPFYLTGPIIAPLSKAVGWSAADISLAVTFHSLGLTLGTPIAGSIMDRRGVRLPALACLAAGALVTALIPFGALHRGGFYALYFLLGLLGAGSGVLVFTRSVGGWFRINRGLALGIALCGTGVAGFLAPNIVRIALSLGDWRLAYFIVGALMAAAWPVIYLTLKEPSQIAVSASEGTRGPKIAAYWRDPRFILLAGIMILFGLGMPGTVLLLVPLQVDAGVTPQAAASIAAFLGLSMVVGRLCNGWLMDRIGAGRVGFSLFALAAFGCVAFAVGGPAWAPVLVICLGLMVGTEADVLAFATMKLFGLARYGRIFGIVLSIMTGASLLSPILMPRLYAAGGARLLLSVAAFEFACAGALFLFLRTPGAAAVPTVVPEGLS